ncbi:response regulator [Brochothrix thermosphacta]|uniref:response regulator n=1 Tax=Brochothrix thermosphacta TaxID=2756 RepID=UPI000EC01517|nr:response regulator [Brochothrix thermosphacta]HCZ39539.1 DNA-binding response regulator [Brochothrix thermosphacta]HCZ46605.1 DNA-binding response regulator [Brochothrix thermosphacta]
MDTTILVIEDDSAISNFMRAILEGNEYTVHNAETGKNGITLCATLAPDIVILDLGLPDMDGLDVLATIRGWSEVPVLIVSARGNEIEKVAALDAGADDYITKPFGTSELLARIRAALRHAQPQGVTESKYVTGELVIDVANYQVALAGKALHLTPIEFKILKLLAQNMGKVLTHDYITKAIWGQYTTENQALRVNMSNIRRKIELNPAEPIYIVTEVGIGYRMILIGD